MYNKTKSEKSWLIALLFSIFLGWLGVHRYYVGKYGTGIIWSITLGFFGIGYIIDIILIATFHFKDAQGNILK